MKGLYCHPCATQVGVMTMRSEGLTFPHDKAATSNVVASQKLQNSSLNSIFKPLKMG